jgi:hypothetical protein
MKHLDSSLESKGAEYLVLGHLLIEGISAYKCDANTAAYDLIAVNPDRKTLCRVQVKSRWATDHNGGMVIKNLDNEFVVFVSLNRGYRHTKAKHGPDPGKKPPRFYVFPTHLLRRIDRSSNFIYLKDIQDHEDYVDRFDLIADHLNPPTLADRLTWQGGELELISAGTGRKLIEDEA